MQEAGLEMGSDGDDKIIEAVGEGSRSHGTVGPGRVLRFYSECDGKL